jgi:hypothetical protein
MKYINEDYKNYYKQRLLENILLEVSNPGSPGEASSEQETAGIRDILGRLGRFFRRPTPVSQYHIGQLSIPRIRHAGNEDP